MVWTVGTVDGGGQQSALYGQYSSIALDSSGNPHISYATGVANISTGVGIDLGYASFNGVAWNKQVIDPALPYWTSLAMDSSNRPRISYFASGFTPDHLKYAAYNGSTWSLTDLANVSRANDAGTSLALNSSDLPRIAYFGQAADLMYASFNGSTWAAQPVDSAGNTGWDPSLALDNSGNAHISYSGAGSVLKYASYNGSSWNLQTIDNYVSYSSLALDASGHPNIIYSNFGTDEIKYAYNNGSGWAINTIGFGYDASIALDGSGHPFVSYTDLSGSLMFAHNNGTSWATDTIDSASGASARQSSIVVAADGTPWISYYYLPTGGVGDELRVARGTAPIQVNSGASYTSVQSSTIGTHPTQFAIVGGAASADTAVSAGGYAPPVLQDTVYRVSDAIQLSGTGNDTFVLQMSYDEAAILAAGISESSLYLGWYNPTLQQWMNSVYGNTGANDPLSSAILGAYNSNQDFHLGWWGVDTVNNTVWAVLNHNSEFAILNPNTPFNLGPTSAVPEPGMVGMWLVGGLVVCGYARKMKGSGGELSEANT